jgi:23S rRNA (adenine2030-N6)-methyltransferase
VNYRHAFHAGNFADLVKHAALLRLLRMATARPEPLFVLDTHAGAGLYDLRAARTNEAAQGVGRLMVEPSPPIFEPLRRAVAALNPSGGATRYPGSPRLIADALRPADRLVACELRPDDHSLLRGRAEADPRSGRGAPHRRLRRAGRAAAGGACERPGAD